jgi:predicted metal-binding membrane protein
MTTMHARERAVTGAALAVVTALAWGYLLMQGSHDGMAGSMAMPRSADWGLGMLAMSIPMWAVMMVAMMLPSAAPMILTFSRVHQQRAAGGKAAVPTWLFVVGYLGVWVGFGLLAAVAQWGLHQSALLSSAMGEVGSLLGGGLLITAGAFQFSGLKEVCLTKCRTPLSFLMVEGRDGPSGALIMGLRHGAFCTGCCWALMLLMFVGGVMSLAWMAALALYFLAEKLLPRPALLGRATGAALIIGGVGVVATGHW